MNKTIYFKHRPKLGDVVYSLPFIRRIYEKTGRPCVLFLDPDSPYFPGAKEEWTEKFKSLIPLIKYQPYISDCKLYNGEPVDYDLDEYMNTTHLTKGDRVSIVENHFIAFNEPYNDLIDGQKWLTFTDNELDNPETTIVARSSNHHNPSVSYQWLQEVPHEEKLFVGTELECTSFIGDTGVIINHNVTENILDLARVIDSGKEFVGNQSLPLAIALGLGKKCTVEESPIYPNSVVGNYRRMK